MQRDEVKVRGLMKRPDLNGRLGMVVSFSEHKGRYSVMLEGESKNLAIKPVNLEHIDFGEGWSDSDESLTLSEDGTYLYLRNGVRHEGTWGSENERLLLVPHLHRLGLYTRVVTVDGELRVLSTFQDSQHWDGSLGLSRTQ